jgi:hypothetical protein
MGMFTTMAKMAFAGSPERRFKVGLINLMRDQVSEFRRFEHNMPAAIIEAALQFAWMEQQSLPELDFVKGAENVTRFLAQAVQARAMLTGGRS